MIMTQMPLAHRSCSLLCFLCLSGQKNSIRFPLVVLWKGVAGMLPFFLRFNPPDLPANVRVWFLSANEGRDAPEEEVAATWLSAKGASSVAG